MCIRDRSNFPRRQSPGRCFKDGRQTLDWRIGTPASSLPFDIIIRLGDTVPSYDTKKDLKTI